jgi:hypothetical protein
MSIDPIVITKENDGDMINFFEESSDGSAADVQISRRPIVRNKRRASSSNRSAPTPSINRAAPLVEKLLKPPPLNDNMFEVFTNPDKKRIEESDEESEARYPRNNEDLDDDYPNPPQYEDEEVAPTEPSAGFSSIEDEKQDLLYKFYRLTSKGIPVGKKFTMSSDIHEMRNEFSRIQRDNDVKSSIRFSRRMLMACVTGIEFLNKRYDPFEVKLDGWSESIMENMDDYDNVFERLHDKYASRVSMAPEIELLLSLAGSAFMFNLTNSMFNSMPNLKDIAKQNPDILKNLMQSIQNASNTTNTTKEDPPAQQQQQQQQGKSTKTQPPPPPLARVQNQNKNTNTREMKPPAFDMSSLFESMPIGNATFPIASRETDRVVEFKKPILKRSNSGSSLSSLSGMSSHSLPNTLKIVSIDTSQASKSRRKKKITATKHNTISI